MLPSIWQNERWQDDNLERAMAPLAWRFQSLSKAGQRSVHFAVCFDALEAWRNYALDNATLGYQERVCGTFQAVDMELPHDAYHSAAVGKDLAKVASRYMEPITAMQDGDLDFPEPINFAYYAIYNLFEHYAMDQPVKPWLIVNQAISADPSPSQWVARLRHALEAVPISVAQGDCP